MTVPDRVLVADWSKNKSKRVTYQVEVAQRCVKRLEPPAGGWTIKGLVDVASQPCGGSSLVLIDVAVGLPLGLFNAMRELCGRPEIDNFLKFLRAQLPGDWLGNSQSHEDWEIRKPYIHVPKGHGSLRDFLSKAAEFGVCLHRAIDLATGGRCPLILSGIPGTVGSGSLAVIDELGSLDVKVAAVWPFDGPLAQLLGSGRVVLGEIYPRALYGHSLLDEPSDKRCLVAIGKTKGEIRTAAVAKLEGLQWHGRLGVPLDKELLQRARGDEDDFDAYLSSLGILRLLLEDVSLEDNSMQSRTCEHGRPLLDSIAEGGMLGVLATQFDHKQIAFIAPPSAYVLDSPDSQKANLRERQPMMEPWVRVTSGIIKNAENHPNNRQISFSGLPSGTNNTPCWVTIEYEGRLYELTIQDTTSCWRGHQIATDQDFDALYDLLRRKPDVQSPVELVEARKDVDESDDE